MVKMIALQLQHTPHWLTHTYCANPAQRVKDIERVTNHDVKAVEYALKELVSSYNHHAL